MPDREYYLSDSPEIRDMRSKYRRHVATMLKLAGFSDTDARAVRIVELEHAIAEKHVPFADEQDTSKVNKSWKRADFASKAPGLDRAEYFRGAGLSQQASFIVWQPTAFTGESGIDVATHPGHRAEAHSMAITGTVGWIVRENLPEWQAALRSQADRFALMRVRTESSLLQALFWIAEYFCRLPLPIYKVDSPSSVAYHGRDN